MKKQIDVLGTCYSIRKDTSENNRKLANNNGYIELLTKEIIIEPSKQGADNLENINAFNRNVLRHEVIHAFFYESGLSEYVHNETLTDWLAIQFPKIAKAFRELKIEK
ncbi:MAG: hypothetical protein M0R51_13505 [Clostridia bacterium]|jgi:hypothetical protein|nr:hypothetical protein [Clostridia bacterium]